jgi:uncharacterized repeat protein (TIGR02543 family)
MAGGVPPVAPITRDANTAVEKPEDPAKSGFDFIGWFSAAIGGTLYTGPHTLTSDITMYAQWRAEEVPPPAQYAVTFNVGTGGANPPQSQTVNGGESISLPGQGSMTAPAYKVSQAGKSAKQPAKRGISTR